MSIVQGLARVFGRGEPIERKSITLTDPEAFGLFGAQPVASGVSVTHASAMRVPAVDCAIGLISETCGALPFKLHDRGAREAVKDHPAYRLIHDEANPWTSAEELREAMTLDALLRGHGYAQVVRTSEGKPMELHRMDPGAVSIETDHSGEPSYRVRLKDGGDVILPYTEVLTVQPAFETVLEVHSHAVTLRASLRAAVAIDTLPGGFPQVWQQIARQSLSQIRAVILATATDRQEVQSFLAAAADKPLASFLDDAQAACLAVLAALIKAGDDSAADAPSHGSTSGAPMPLREYFKTLYRYATGWLGWTPTETWNASPAEIEAAFQAHSDRLVMLRPGLAPSDPSEANASTPYTPERLREIEELGYDPAFDRAGLHALKAKHL